MSTMFPDGRDPNHNDSLEITLKKLLEAIAPAPSAAAITPGATALAQVTRAIKCGDTAGTVTVTMASGQAGVVIPIGAYDLLPVQVTHVTAATATPLVALW